MKVIFVDLAWEDYIHWQQIDKTILRKINSLIKEVKRTPFEGTGKPESLQYHLSGWWSRRITHEHRLVYRVKPDAVIILQCRHYYQ